MTIEELLARIERHLEILALTVTGISIAPAPKIGLKPFNRTKYADAIRRARQGEYALLQEYLQEYEGPQPKKRKPRGGSWNQ